MKHPRFFAQFSCLLLALAWLLAFWARAEEKTEPPPEVQVDQFFSQFGPHKDRVTFEEFRDHTEGFFKKVDQDGDRILTREEFLSFIKKHRALAARIEPKVRKVQAYLESFQRKGEEMQQMFQRMKKVEEAMQAGKPEEAERLIDEILAMAEKQR